MTTIAHFENLADSADYRALKPYKPTIHAWVYIENSELSIGQVASAFYHGNLEMIEAWTELCYLKFYKELENVPVSDWMVVLVEPFYIMKSKK
jgi:hypothetical protein